MLVVEFDAVDGVGCASRRGEVWGLVEELSSLLAGFVSGSAGEAGVVCLNVGFGGARLATACIAPSDDRGAVVTGVEVARAPTGFGFAGVPSRFGAAVSALCGFGGALSVARAIGGFCGAAFMVRAVVALLAGVANLGAVAIAAALPTVCATLALVLAAVPGKGNSCVN